MYSEVNKTRSECGAIFYEYDFKMFGIASTVRHIRVSDITTFSSLGFASKLGVQFASVVVKSRRVFFPL